MVRHDIIARSEGRSKRPREQAVPVGMQVENQPNTNASSYAMSNGGGSDDKMDVESCSNQATNGDRTSGQSHKQNYSKNRSSPKQVTDDSCESEDTEKGKPSNDSYSSQGHADVRHPLHHGYAQQVNEAGNNINNSQKESVMKQAGPVMEDDQQSSASVVIKVSVPQHERIQHVEPLDINYRSTPSCVKLREALLSRLQLIAPTGRIQVVSHLRS